MLQVLRDTPPESGTLDGEIAKTYSAIVDFKNGQIKFLADGEFHPMVGPDCMELRHVNYSISSRSSVGTEQFRICGELADGEPVQIIGTVKARLMRKDIVRVISY